MVIFIDTPTDVRIERLCKREYERFGERICKGGDMYDEHTEFIAWAKTYDTNHPPERCRKLHMEWLKDITCPTVYIDGTKPTSEILNQVKTLICDRQIT